MNVINIIEGSIGCRFVASSVEIYPYSGFRDNLSRKCELFNLERRVAEGHTCSQESYEPDASGLLKDFVLNQ